MTKNSTSEFDEITKEVDEIEKTLPLEVKEEPTLEDIKIGVGKLANPKCKKCYGRGYIGINSETQKIILCNGRRCSLIKYYFMMHKHQAMEKEASKVKEEEKADGQT